MRVKLTIVGKRPPPTVGLKAASDLLEAFWCQDTLGVMLAGVQVLGTEVKLFFTKLACNTAHGVSAQRKENRLSPVVYVMGLLDE